MIQAGGPVADDAVAAASAVRTSSDIAPAGIADVILVGTYVAATNLATSLVTRVTTRLCIGRVTGWASVPMPAPGASSATPVPAPRMASTAVVSAAPVSTTAVAASAVPATTTGATSATVRAATATVITPASPSS